MKIILNCFMMEGEEYDINSIQNLNHPITLIHKDKDDATNDVT